MIINGVELKDIDIAELSVAENYENAMEIIKKGSQFEKNEKRSQIIRRCCNSTFEAFDLIFGNGTARKVFGGQTNLTVCLKAVEELVTQVKELEKNSIDDIQKNSEKYFNRDQKRHNNKNKKHSYNNRPHPNGKR